MINQVDFHKWQIEFSRQSTFQFWTVLLSASSIVVSAFSALAFLADRGNLYFSTIVIFGLLSIGLLMMNFRASLKLARYIQDLPAVPTQEERKNIREEWERKHFILRIREHIVVGILSFQALFIIAMLIAFHK